MSSQSKQHAIAVLSNVQIRHADEFDAAAATLAVRREIEAIRREQGQTAMRGLRLGIVLWCVKRALPHGAFMPWVKDSFAAHYSTATRYMKLARYFVEKTGADLPEIMEIEGAQIELALDAANGPQAAIFRKAQKFIGDKSLSELLAEATGPSALATGAETDPTPAANPGEIIVSQTAEHLHYLKRTLLDDAALLHVSKQIGEQIKDDLWSLYEGYRTKHEQRFGRSAAPAVEV